MSNEKHVVTGAFSFTGRFIAEELLARGKYVITLTRNPNAALSLGTGVPAFPFHFEDPAQLVKTLDGAQAVYNTYWVRFPHGQVSFDQAVANTRVLIDAAKEAGVSRFIHISVSNPTEDSILPYFKGKAVLERMVRESGLSYAIIRPTLIFGPQDILINNIAWLLRRFPLFCAPGAGDYRVQPVAGEDVALLAVEAAEQHESRVLDAAGPEIFRFDDFVRLIARAVGSQALVVHLPPAIVALACRLVGTLVHDVVLTRQEMAGLMAQLLISHEPARGSRRFSEWLSRNGGSLGQRYASELQRNYRMPGESGDQAQG